MKTTEKIEAIEKLLKMALSSQYTDDYQQGRAGLASEIGEILNRDEEDAPLPPDPRFPDRPTHPDFARLSSAIIEQDAVSEAVSLEEAIHLDIDSALYLARQRVHAAFDGVPIPRGHSSRLLTIYLDGLNVGAGFQNRGGHRPAETGNAGDKEGSE